MPSPRSRIVRPLEVPAGIVTWIWWRRSGTVGPHAYEILVQREDRVFSIGMTPGRPPDFSEPRDVGLDLASHGIIDIASVSGGRFLVIRRPDDEVGSADVRLALGWADWLRDRTAD